MRIYSRDAEEALRARKLLAGWKHDGFLSAEQFTVLEKQTVSPLRTTNIFLRLVLFLFTVIGVGAAVGLFFVMFFTHAQEETIGGFLLFFAPVCYAAAEAAASRFRLYRYGIEEALAACSVGLLCLGIGLTFFTHTYGSHPVECIIPGAGALLALWIWRRFGLWYAFLAAEILVAFLPSFWQLSRSEEHVLIALLFAAGVLCLTAFRPRDRFDSLQSEYSLAEALLWLGIYIDLNLKLSGLDPRAEWWLGTNTASQFPKPFYWTTFVLIWVLPAVVLALGIRRKDRFVLATGLITAVLTLISNKPYLGWPRHTWDPMLLGIFLIAVAVVVRRALDRGLRGIRYGFTAARVSSKQKQWMSIASPALGIITPQQITPAAQTTGDFHFGGGSSGGGGASGDF